MALATDAILLLLLPVERIYLRKRGVVQMLLVVSGDPLSCRPHSRAKVRGYKMKRYHLMLTAAIVLIVAMTQSSSATEAKTVRIQEEFKFSIR